MLAVLLGAVTTLHGGGDGDEGDGRDGQQVMIRQRRATRLVDDAASPAPAADGPSVGRLGIVLSTAAFVLLQATDATAMTMLTIYVTDTVQLDILWAGVALGLAAALEVPALVLIGRLTERHSSIGLIATSCVAGIAYFVGLAFVTEPIALLALQPLNDWSFAGFGGVGLTLSQQLIARPGLATGLYMNTRRIGSIVSGPIIAFGSLTVLGQRGIFLTSAAVTGLGLLVIAAAHAYGRRRQTTARAEPRA